MESFSISVSAILYQSLMIGLIALFMISFILFIRRLLINSTIRRNQTIEMNQKLDRIIELLEDEKNLHKGERL